MSNNIFDAFNSAAKQASPSSEQRKPKSGKDILQFGNKGKKISELYFRILPGNGILNNDIEHISDFAVPFRTIFLKANDPSSDKKTSYYNPMLSPEANPDSKIEQAISRWEQNGALQAMIAPGSSYGAPSVRTRAYLNVIPVLSSNNNFYYSVDQTTNQPIVQVMDVPSTVVRDILEKLGNKLNAPQGSTYSFIDLKYGALAHIALKDNKYQFDVYPQVVLPELTTDWVRQYSEDLSYLSEPTETYKTGFEEHFIKLVDNSVNATAPVEPSQISQSQQTPFFGKQPSAVGGTGSAPDPFGLNNQKNEPQGFNYGTPAGMPNPNDVQIKGQPSQPLNANQPSDSLQDGTFPNTSTNNSFSGAPTSNGQGFPNPGNGEMPAPTADISNGNDLIDMDELARIANSQS